MLCVMWSSQVQINFSWGLIRHPTSSIKKESACGCAGCYSAWSAIELYAQVFEDIGALDKFEGFASYHGPDFYGLARNTGSITLERQPWMIPDNIQLEQSTAIVPFMAGTEVNWKLVDVSE